jgi:Flp pilus assembly pilin Flp
MERIFQNSSICLKLFLNIYYNKYVYIQRGISNMIYYKKKIQQDVGATAVEYGILSALIAVVTILGLQATGTNLGTTYCTIANELSQAVGAGNTASGCSATSSSSYSSSSADSSGSSADSSSSSSSDISSSSDSSADSSSDSSSGTVYNASNSYSMKVSGLGAELGLLNTIMNGSVHGTYVDSTITGLYDDSGNAITSMDDLRDYYGISDSVWSSGLLASSNSTSDTSAKTALQNAITSSGKNIYIPDPTGLTFTSSMTTLNRPDIGTVTSGSVLASKGYAVGTTYDDLSGNYTNGGSTGTIITLTKPTGN